MSFNEMIAFGCRAINYLWSVDVYPIIVLKTLVSINYNNYVYYWRSRENVSNYIYMLRVERTTVFCIKKKKKKWYNKNDVIRWNNYQLFLRLLIIIFQKQKFTTNSTNSTSKTLTRHAHIHNYESILLIV